MGKYNLTVMIVDNDLTFVEELSEMLQNGGYRSFACTSANVSLPVVRQQRPDIILLDINQDEVDGYQLALRLRKDPQLARVPIIAMSAYFDCQPHDITFAGISATFGYPHTCPTPAGTIRAVFAFFFPDRVTFSASGA